MKDNEWAGVGNSYEFDFRGYDPRIARFRSVDPLTSGYPSLTPYQFAGNTPIWAKDLEGLERDYSSGGNPDADANNVTKGFGADCEGNSDNPAALPDLQITGAASSHPADPNAGLNGTYGQYSIMQARDLNLGYNPEGRRQADLADQAAIIWLGVGAAPFAAIGGVEAAPAMLSGYLSNPVLWNSVAVDGLAGLAGYTGPGVSSDLGAMEQVSTNAEANLWKVGAYNEIRGLEVGLDAHHVGQKVLMNRFILGFNSTGIGV